MSATDIIVAAELILSIVVVTASIFALTIVFKSPPQTNEEKKRESTAKKLSAKCTFIKVLIWVGTYLTANVIEVLLGYLIRDSFPDYYFPGTGIPGPIPKMIFWTIAFFVARKLCRIYNEHFMEKYGNIIAECEAENTDPVKKDSSNTRNTDN